MCIRTRGPGAGNAITAVMLAISGLAVAADPARATAPGENGSIVFNRSGPAVHADILSVTPDGALRRRLGEGQRPAWSPDGLRLVFSAQMPDSNIELASMAADGSDRQQITPFQSAFFAAWSPDGTKIAFASYSTMTGNYDIWVIDADGSNPVNLTNHAAEDVAPTWSPDGTKIAFQTNRDGDREIYVVVAGGGSQTNLTNRHTSEDELPDWSPDGTKIVFAASSDIISINADGSGATTLVDSDFGSQPVWSPDGKQIAFVDYSSGNGDIRTVKTDGTGMRRLTDDGEYDSAPNWQPLRAENRTTTTVASPADTIHYGEPATFTGRVTPSAPAREGGVQFRVNGINEGDPTELDGASQVTFDPPFLLDVGDVVSATYGGDVRWGWSAGAAPLRVLPAATSTTITSAPNPVQSGGTVDVFAKVANLSTDVAPFGSVQFTIDGQPLESPVALDEDGQVELGLIADIGAGDYRVAAHYRDDTADVGDFVASSASFVQRVTVSAAATPPSPVASGAAARVRRADLEQFAARLARALRRRGLGALGGPGTVFTAGEPGVLTQQVSLLGGSRARATAQRRTLLASGRRRFAQAGAGRVRLRLARAGKRLLRHPKRVRIQIVTRFAPIGRKRVAVSALVTVGRRGSGRARARSAGWTVLPRGIANRG